MCVHMCWNSQIILRFLPEIVHQQLPKCYLMIDYLGLPKPVMDLLRKQVLDKAVHLKWNIFSSGKFTELKRTWMPTIYSEQDIVKDKQSKRKPPSAIKRDQRRRADFLKKTYDSNQQLYRISQVPEIPKTQELCDYSM